ncbi:MAG: hypothetical protein ACHQKZ_08985 [Solirubrobacterales bacterium]|jgi:hypothetical protein
MRRLVLAALLLAAPAAGAERTDTATDLALRAPHTVRLVWWDPERVVSQDFDRLESEVQAVFRPIGIEIVSRRAEGASVTGELNVVFLSGDRAPGHERQRAMGRVKRDRNTALWIFTGTVREALGLARPAGGNKALAELRDYPRALGRVVAHEIVHTLVPDEPHASSGLMQASLGRDFLAGPRAPIDRRFASALARRLLEESAAEPALVAADVARER